jgi:hypothetical protein
LGQEEAVIRIASRSVGYAVPAAVAVLSSSAVAWLAVAAQSPPAETTRLAAPSALSEAAAADATRRAALAFRDSLGPELAKQATFALDHAERRAWSNLPAAMFPREGVSFGQMTDEQRRQAHALLQTPLSTQGYLKVAGIMRIDEILKSTSPAMRDGRSMFGQDLYWLGLFGDLEAGPWGLQLDGHHLALNFTLVGGEVSVTPMFKGSDPAEVRTGLDAGWYPLAGEDRRGRALWESLDAAQRAVALLPGATPRDVIAGPTRTDPISALEVQGLPYSAMSPTQQALLLRLLGEWIGDLDPDLAAVQMARVREGGLEALHFAWSGVEEGQPYYYRVHGPTLLIELDNNFAPGRGGGAVNHIHSVWRDPARDYGEDLLAEHYRESPHHQGDGARAAHPR